MNKHTIEKSMLLLAKGQTGALKIIYEELCQAVYHLSYSILKDHQLAEDNAQEVFIKLLTSSKSYNKGQGAVPWIMSITRNCAIDMIRRQKNTYYTDFTLEEDGEESILLKDNSSDIEEQTCDKIVLMDVIGKLDSTSREIIILHLNAGLKFNEISNVLKIPLGTVTWKYQTAIKKLKQLLHKRDN